MKKISILILSVSISFSALAQKKELKNIEKLIKNSNFSEATEGLKGLESMVTATKYESYYYFLEGKAAFGDDKTNDYEKAAKYFYKTLEVAQVTGNDKYSEKAINYINTINNHYIKMVNKSLKNDDYKKIRDSYQVLHNINPSRKDHLENLLYCHLKLKEYKEAGSVLEKLLNSVGDTVYNALNKNTSTNNAFLTEKARDREVSLGVNIAPTESKLDKNVRLDYYTNLVAIYEQEGEFEKEIVKLKEAKKEYPKHVPFYENYASVIYRTGDKEAYLVALEEVLELSPKNKNMWYNLGVISQGMGLAEKSENAYDKVIELDPTYRNAYINKGLVILSEERPLIKELNKSSGTKKYALIKKQITDIYQQAIPLFEKAYELKKDDEVKKNLIGLYDAVGDKAKAEALE